MNNTKKTKAEKLNNVLVEIKQSFAKLRADSNAIRHELEAAEGRHSQWLADFVNTADRIPSDSALLAKENEIRKRLVSQDIDSLSTKISGLLSTTLLKDVLVQPSGPWEGLTVYYRRLNTLEHRRHEIAKELYNMVTSLSHLKTAYSEEQKRLEVYARTRRSLRVTASSIDDLIDEVLFLRQDAASPKLALRKVHILGILLEDIQNNLTRPEVPDVLRVHLSGVLEDGLAFYQSNRVELEALTNEDLNIYADTRSSEVEYSMLVVQHYMGFVPAKCRALGQKAAISTADIESEISYQEYISCINY